MAITTDGGTVHSCLASSGGDIAIQVEWPLNMVVDRSTQNLYQALLRHLLGLAMVERELHIIWRTYQSTRALFRCAHLPPPLYYLPMAQKCIRRTCM